LKCIENIDYDTKSLSLYVHTNNNSDGTTRILREWCKVAEASGKYNSVKFVEQYFPVLFGKVAKSIHPVGGDDAWYADNGIRLKILSEIRDTSLNYAVMTGADYYFVCDVDNFFPPETIRKCVEQDKPIFAPMMVQNNGGVPRGFYLKVDPHNGYMNDSREVHDMSIPIWNKTIVGTFLVELVHMCYMVRTNEVHKGLKYYTDGVQMEYVTFAASARRNGIDQFVSNEIQTLIDPTDDYDTNVDICKNLHYHLA